MKNLLNNSMALLNGHTPFQIWNTFKYLLKNKNEILTYDPLYLSIYVTDRCTLKCNMCHAHSEKKLIKDKFAHDPCEDMSFDTFRLIADRFSNALFLGLVGTGEPFLNKDIFKMIRYGQKLNMDVSIISNGTMLEDKIDKILNSSLNSISISLNGYNSREFQETTGNECKYFDIIVKNVETIVQERNIRQLKKPKIRISNILYKKNYKYAPKFINLAKDLGVDVVDFHNLIPSDIDGFGDNECLFDDDTDVIEMLSHLDVNESDPIVNLPTLYSRRLNYNTCPDYFQSIRVDSRGYVTSCHSVIQANKIHGNVFEDDDVWNSSHFTSMRRMFLGKRPPYPECCRMCSCMSNYKFK